MFVISMTALESAFQSDFGAWCLLLTTLHFSAIICFLSQYFCAFIFADLQGNLKVW